MSQGSWDACLQKWNTEEWKNKSRINTLNRNSTTNGEPAKHTAGSVSYACHQARMKNKSENGAEPTPMEVFLKTHKKANEEFVDERSRETHDKYNMIVKEKYGPDSTAHPSFDAEAWTHACNGPRKVRVYVLGNTKIATQIVNSSRRPRNGKNLPKSQVVDLQNQVADLKNDKQQLEERIGEMEVRQKKEMAEIRESMETQISERVRLMLQDLNIIASILNAASGLGSKG